MKRLLVNFTTAVNRSNIRREVRNGDEFIIIRSATLPDNVVMNGGLYPAEEIEKSYMTLEGKLAPLGHPQDAKGNFILAASQYAIDNFYVGAANENVTRENGRVFVDKAINVSKAMTTDKGKRLMDRVNALANGGGEPIHTSTGVLLQQREEEGITANGQEYTWVAENMAFDHDCLLLDEPGAATPEQGVGMAVNNEGDKLDVQFAMLPEYTCNTEETPQTLLAKLGKMLGFAESSKHAYNSDSKYLHNEGDKAMKNRMMDALKKANRYKDGMDDDAMMNAYDEMMMEKGMKKNMGDKKNMDDDKGMKKNSEDDLSAAISAAVTNALAPMAEKIDAIEAAQQAGSDASKQKLIDVIVNSGQGYDAEDLKDMSETMLTKMATNCANPMPAHMVSPGFAVNSKDDAFDYANMEAPE